MADDAQLPLPPRRRRRLGRPRKGASAAWDDAASVLLLRLRFDEMKARFATSQTTLAVADTWTQLTDELNARTQRSDTTDDSSADVTDNMHFDTQQCQNKVRLCLIAPCAINYLVVCRVQSVSQSVSQSLSLMFFAININIILFS